MAGSLSHIVDDDGSFRVGLIENLGDAHEALEECHQIIAYLCAEDEFVIRQACRTLGFPGPKAAPRLNNE